jgi:Flp pilus assembly protein TadB
VIALGAIACAVAIASLALGVSPGFRHFDALTERAFAEWLRAAVHARRSEARAARCALPLLQSVHAALRSGLPLPLALRSAVADVDAVARGPFEAALRAFDLGTHLDASLRAAAKSARHRRVGLALEALSLVADEQLAASRSAAVIASVADRLAFEERLVDEVRARTAGIRTQILLLAMLVPGLALYLAFTLPGLATTLQSPLGLRVLLPGALVFEAAGLVASRHIVRALEG